MRPIVSAILAIAALLPASALAQSPPASTTASPNIPPCAPDVQQGVLPDWARAGFVDPEPEATYSLSRGGQILGILFGFPLSAPSRPDANNKILWVSPRADGHDLVIAGQWMEGTRPVGDPVQVSIPGGPGPSIVDMPEPGCWRFTLRWAGVVDTMDLEYQPLDASGSPVPSPS